MSTILRSGLEQFALRTQWLENQRADNPLDAFWTEADPSVGGPLRPQTPTMRGKRTRWKQWWLLSLPSSEVHLVYEQRFKMSPSLGWFIIIILIIIIVVIIIVILILIIIVIIIIVVIIIIIIIIIVIIITSS